MLSLSRTFAGLRNLSISARTELKGQKVTKLGKREISGLSEGSDAHLQDTMDYMLKAHQVVTIRFFKEMIGLNDDFITVINFQFFVMQYFIKFSKF